jgi:hypothetical protein
MKTKAIKWLSAQIRDDTTVEQLNLINFIKKCVNEHKVERETENKVDWLPMFETLWKMYPKKSDKLNAKKMFERKVRGLTEEECREKCNLIYKAQMRYQKQLVQNETPLEYTKLYASWLNAEVPNSKHYKGR